MFCPFIFIFLPLHSYSLSPLPSPMCENPEVLNLNLLAEAVHHHHLSSKGLTLTFPFFSKSCQKKGRKKELSVLPSDSALYSCTRASKDSPLLFLSQDHALRFQFTRTRKVCWKCLCRSQASLLVTQHGTSYLPRVIVHTLH